jgi:hypothetical protein
LTANSQICSIDDDHSGALRSLKLVVGVLCLGSAQPLLMGQGDLMDWLGPVRGAGELLAILLVTSGIALLFGVYRGCRWCRLMAWSGWGLLPLVAVFFILNACCRWQLDPGNPLKQGALLNHAVRYAAPAVLFVWMWPFRKVNGQGFPQRLWLMRVAVSATFLGHGLNAFRGSSSHVELIQKTFGNIFNVGVSSGMAESMLDVIACVDVLMAFLLLVRQWRAVALWMTIWGFATAASRLTAYGIGDGWARAAVRVANGGLPLVVWLLWRRRT